MGGRRVGGWGTGRLENLEAGAGGARELGGRDWGTRRLKGYGAGARRLGGWGDGELVNWEAEDLGDLGAGRLVFSGNAAPKIKA